MPTILRWEGYRFFFWSGDRAEPPHVHVKKGGAEAKIWLFPVEIATSVGFAPHETAKILKIVEQNRHHLMRAWHEFFRH